MLPLLVLNLQTFMNVKLLDQCYRLRCGVFLLPLLVDNKVSVIFLASDIKRMPWFHIWILFQVFEWFAM
jgi:hypothetical protein